MHIVPKAPTPDNEKVYARAVAEAGRALRRAVAAQVAVWASFGDREVALLAAANEACRLERVALRHADVEPRCAPPAL